MTAHREIDQSIEPLNVVAFSGGKDSTCLALAMKEHGERIDRLLITPTGDELPEMVAHWDKISRLVGLPLTIPKGPTLDEVIESQKALPNFRMRFCTRMIKILPAIAWVKRQDRPVRLFIGLRADEQERKGIVSGDLDERFPLREWGYGLEEVLGYLDERRISIPRRTDCARCYHQRIGEWWELWANHPGVWMDAEEQERRIGNTFRTPGRDSWPTALVDMRARFELGHVPRAVVRQQKRAALESLTGRTLKRSSQLTILDGDEDEGEAGVCRVCSL
jgi:3'-phosphoadenosine 5'-phosphosulfate sulfotransferase (PAPS reductase)/FAD synthetase